MKKKLIPAKNRPEADLVMTPPALAEAIVKALPVAGTVMDPCAGDDAFYRCLDQRHITTRLRCEISEGSDFFEFTKPVDWVIGNPPWSKYREFARHARSISDEVAFLITINHALGLKARVREMMEDNFGVRKILLVDTPPPPWPQSGFQLGVVWQSRHWRFDTRIKTLDWKS